MICEGAIFLHLLKVLGGDNRERIFLARAYSIISA